MHWFLYFSTVWLLLTPLSLITFSSIMLKKVVDNRSPCRNPLLSSNLSDKLSPNVIFLLPSVPINVMSTNLISLARTCCIAPYSLYLFTCLKSTKWYEVSGFVFTFVLYLLLAEDLVYRWCVTPETRFVII